MAFSPERRKVGGGGPLVERAQDGLGTRVQSCLGARIPQFTRQYVAAGINPTACSNVAIDSGNRRSARSAMPLHQRPSIDSARSPRPSHPGGAPPHGDHNGKQFECADPVCPGRQRIELDERCHARHDVIHALERAAEQPMEGVCFKTRGIERQRVLENVLGARPVPFVQRRPPSQRGVRHWEVGIDPHGLRDGGARLRPGLEWWQEREIESTAGVRDADVRASAYPGSSSRSPARTSEAPRVSCRSYMQMQALQIGLIRLDVGRVLATSGSDSGGADQPRPERAHDALGDRVLDLEDVRHRAIEPIGPHRALIAHVHYLRRDAETLARANAPGADGARRARRRSVPGRLSWRAPETSTHTGCHSQTIDLRQRVDDFFGHSLAEIRLIALEHSCR